MNDIAQAPLVAEYIPTVEAINLEYRLSQSKASEAVQHAINCGLMLLQVKASLKHGEWLPWLKQQQESGAVEFTSGRFAGDFAGDIAAASALRCVCLCV